MYVYCIYAWKLLSSTDRKKSFGSSMSLLNHSLNPRLLYLPLPFTLISCYLKFILASFLSHLLTWSGWCTLTSDLIRRNNTQVCWNRTFIKIDQFALSTSHMMWSTLTRLSWFRFPFSQSSSIKLVQFKDNQQKMLFICNFRPKMSVFFSILPSLLLHPHRGCLLLWSCHLAESRVWWRGDSMAGLREATKLHSSVSPFYHPALSVPGCQTIYY